MPKEQDDASLFKINSTERVGKLVLNNSFTNDTLPLVGEVCFSPLTLNCVNLASAKACSFVGDVDGLTKLYTNIDSLSNKCNELLNIIKDTKSQIIALTEILSKNYKYLNEADYELPNYEVFK